MDRYDMIEQLVLRTGVSYEQAKNALIACDWDLDDAEEYLTNGEKTVKKEAREAEETEDAGKGGFFDGVLSFAAELFEKGNRSLVDVSKDGKKLFTVSLTVLVLLYLLCFWVMLPLTIAGPFFGFRYRFHNDNEEQEEKVNDILEKATAKAEEVKRSFKETKDSEEDQ